MTMPTTTTVGTWEPCWEPWELQIAGNLHHWLLSAQVANNRHHALQDPLHSCGSLVAFGIYDCADISEIGSMPYVWMRLSSGSVFPPTIVRGAVADSLCRTDFLAGQYFDIRLEVHAPVNGSQANGGKPDPNFTFTIAKGNGTAQNASTYFKQAEPKLERWNFTWFEGTDPLRNGS